MLNSEQFPAFCAHRGLSGILPENSMSAFGAAWGLGADELELDIRLTKDEKLVISHDDHLQRVAGRPGLIQDFTLEELTKIQLDPHNACISYFTTPEMLFARFGGSIILNLHIKESRANEKVIRQIASLIHAHHLEDSVYFAASAPELQQMECFAPEIRRCAIQLPRDTIPILDVAQRYGCFRVQLWRDMFDQALINTFHDKGIRCNLYYADTPEDIWKYTAMGIDVILTNRIDVAKSDFAK